MNDLKTRINCCYQNKLKIQKVILCYNTIKFDENLILMSCYLDYLKDLGYHILKIKWLVYKIR